MNDKINDISLRELKSPDYQNNRCARIHEYILPNLRMLDRYVVTQRKAYQFIDQSKSINQTICLCTQVNQVN